MHETAPLHQLDLACNADQTRLLTDWVQQVCSAMDVPEMVTARAQLVLEELFANIVMHGGAEMADSKLKPVRVGLSCVDNILKIDWRDRGAAFDPLTLGDDHWQRDDVGDRPVGGLGLMLVNQLCQDKQYRREGQYNLLFLGMPCGY